MSVKTREQEQTAAEVAAANLANQAGKVRDAVGRWAAQFRQSTCRECALR